MKTLTIEWKHLEKDGVTCTRCGETGSSLRCAVEVMRRQCVPYQIHIRFVETKLPVKRLTESNEILFNGIPLESALSDARVSSSKCGSCSRIAGEASDCRTIQHHGETYEAIPTELIWQAACRVVDCECPA